MSQRPGQEIGWVPKTKLGRQVQQGEIISMEEIFTQGLRIKEPEIVDTLLPNIQQEVLGIGFVQKQTDAGWRCCLGHAVWDWWPGRFRNRFYDWPVLGIAGPGLLGLRRPCHRRRWRFLTR